MKLHRVVVMLFGALFATIGIGFWVAPEMAADSFGIGAVATSGLVALRAELGGLFIGLAALCLAGAWLKSRALLLAAAVLVGAVVAGRVVGVFLGGVRISEQLPAFAVEIVAIATFAVGARAAGRPEPARRIPGARFLVAALALAAGVVLTWIALPNLQLRLFERVAAQMTARDNAQLLGDDAMRVAICGSSAPLASPSRAKSCVAILVGQKFYVVDVGPESVENLVRWGIPLATIDGVLLTHFHSDHIGDLGELNLQTWAQGRPKPLDVYGGPGVDQVVNGFNQAYRIDQGYRTAHHTARLMPAEAWPLVARPIELPGPETEGRSRSALVLDDGTLRITAIEVDHQPVAPAYAYRFDYKGRSVVVSGDLKVHPPLATAASKADVLVIEAIARPMVRALEAGAKAAGRDRQAAILYDIQDYHISPVEAAQLANEAGVKLLVFYHLLPAPDSLATRRLFASDVGQVRSRDWILADDSSLYTLPIGSDEVRIGRIER
jgi:ribonuclease Z